MIETERLILRPYRDADRAPLAAMNADPRVGAWLAGTLSREASDALIDRLQAHIEANGWGWWAAELRVTGEVVGMIGLSPPGLPEVAQGRSVEMGWRLSPSVWGLGLSTEGARAALDWALGHLDVDEVYAITAATNLRSQAVMTAIGLEARPERAFDHPRVPPGNPLRPHVLHARAP